MPQQVILSVFQKEKLRSFFNFLEPDADGKLESQSLDRIMKRILEFTAWSPDSVKAHHCREVYETFLEILFEKSADIRRGSVYTLRCEATLEDWYRVWENLLPGCKGMSNMPVWLRLMPKILFEMIDRNGDNLITADEMIVFFKKMIKIDDPDLDRKVKNAVKEMTDDGRYPLNLSSYEQIFANFLLGKTPHGPGKYIFGLFNHEDYHFQLIRQSDDTETVSSKKHVMTRRPSRAM